MGVGCMQQAALPAGKWTCLASYDSIPADRDSAR